MGCMTVNGYIRVSSGEQNEDRQLDAMEKAHVPFYQRVKENEVGTFCHK